MCNIVTNSLHKDALAIGSNAEKQLLKPSPHIFAGDQAIVPVRRTVRLAVPIFPSLRVSAKLVSSDSQDMGDQSGLLMPVGEKTLIQLVFWHPEWTSKDIPHWETLISNIRLTHPQAQLVPLLPVCYNRVTKT
jgi:hypothetical protein